LWQLRQQVGDIAFAACVDADPSRIAVTTVQIFCVEARQAREQCKSFLLIRRSAA
jgi:hypothetical protein